jgi:hypothetical protein
MARSLALAHRPAAPSRVNGNTSFGYFKFITVVRQVGPTAITGHEEGVKPRFVGAQKSTIGSRLRPAAYCAWQ